MRSPFPPPLSAVLMPVALVACGPGDTLYESSPLGDTSTIGCASAAIIDGTEVPAAALDAVGTLGVFDEQGSYRPFCSATLIATDVVLTAKHCTLTRNGAELPVEAVFFGIGSDGERPRQLLRAIAVQRSAPMSGGVAQLGSDVAVYRLADPVSDVPPLPLSPVRLADQPEGRALAVYGYGPVRPACSGGPSLVRRGGSLALGPSRGNVFDFIYGDYASYRAQAHEEPAGYLDERYRNGVLLEEYEAWAFETESRSQTCHGDSGGPVTLARNGSEEIVGVTSWAWHSSERECDFGTVFAVFGPDVVSFLAGVR